MAYTRRNFLNLIARSEPRADDCWLHVSRTAMACRFEVTLPRSEETGVVAATEALDEVDRLARYQCFAIAAKSLREFKCSELSSKDL
jgi:hypothetical protein